MDHHGDNWTLHVGDVRARLADIATGSVHAVVTSPPYWGGIRDYKIPTSTWGDGWVGCYGNEPTVAAYIAHTLEIFDFLRDDGVIWWNLGDTYSQYNCNRGESKSLSGKADPGRGDLPPGLPDSSIKLGNKALVPHRVAIALQDAGWIVRQDVVWKKPSPMPESIDGVRWERCRVKVKDGEYRRSDAPNAIPSGWNTRHELPDDTGRFTEQKRTHFAPCPGCRKCSSTGGYVLRRGAWRPTTAHEFVFQIVKQSRYFCDADAASEAVTGNAHSRGKGDNPKTNGAKIGREKQNESFSVACNKLVETRNPRSVWSISSEPLKAAHFAAYPTMLAWKCIQASTSAVGCCPACGAQYAPVIERDRVPTRPGNDSKVENKQTYEGFNQRWKDAKEVGNRDPERHVAVKKCTGHRPTCDCNAGDPVPATVCDPFTGSGTTLQVAINTGRRFVGCEIAEHYVPLILDRAAKPWEPKGKKKPKPVKPTPASSLPGQRTMF